MTGTSPFTFQSPSFHSSSYLPKLEANFMRDFQCCGVTLPTLHDLLQHYEEVHATRSAQQGPREARASIAAALAQQQNPLPNQKALKPGQSQLSQQHPDLDAIDDMELDEAMDGPPSQIFSQVRNNDQGVCPGVGAGAGAAGGANETVPSLNMAMLQGFNGGQPETPTNPISLQNNPTVSSVNTPALMANPLQNAQFRQTPDSSAPGTPSELDESIVDGLGDLSMQKDNNSSNAPAPNQPKFALNNDMVDLCIDEPAKRLFSPNSGFASTLNNTQFKLSGAQYGPNSEIARRIREQQLLAGVPDMSILLPNEEPKPFRCPVIGCEKAYKNQNGLKYHKAVSGVFFFFFFELSIC